MVKSIKNYLDRLKRLKKYKRDHEIADATILGIHSSGVSEGGYAILFLANEEIRNRNAYNKEKFWWMSKLKR